jgi:hypothetical protein
MNYRILLGIALVGCLTSASTALAQSESAEPISKLSANASNAAPVGPYPNLLRPTPKPSRSPENPMFAVRNPRFRFVVLSTAVYGAALADMHQTLQVRNLYWWYETDPLARPFAHLPAPAYYATGFAMATGVNWLSWKMAHSRRWHKFAPIPQLLTIGGNLYGYHSNRD